MLTALNRMVGGGICVATLLSSIALGASQTGRWVSVPRYESSQWDSATVTRLNKDKIAVWVKQDPIPEAVRDEYRNSKMFSNPFNEQYRNVADKIKLTVSKYSIDCARRTLQILETNLYDGNGMALAVQAVSYDRQIVSKSAPFSIIPDTQGEALLLAVCQGVK